VAILPAIPNTVVFWKARIKQVEESNAGIQEDLYLRMRISWIE